MNRTTNLNRLNDNGLNGIQIANPPQRTLRQLAVLAVLLVAAVTATAQTQSVIMNGNYYLTHNEAGTTVNTAATNTFNPATCLWVFAEDNYIRTANSKGQAITSTTNNYLQYTSVALGGDGFDWYNAVNNSTVYHRTGRSGNRTYYYLRLNGTTWQINQTNSNQGTLYAVTITTTDAAITDPTISGADVLTATGNSSYSASGAAYRGSYTNYYFNNADHYINANGDNFTGAPTDAAIGAATWSISDNAYATVNASNGTVTVNSLPENDVELTLTVTYPVTAGTGRPAAPAGITLTATKTITIQGNNPSAPIITVNGTSVTLATDAVGSTTIRYTIDGSNPTTSTGTVYSGSSFDLPLTTSPVTIKAITVRGGNASSVTEQEVTLTLPAPTITADASAGTATISSSVAGATIYYTTDGSTPTTSSSQYTGALSDLSVMTTIKAIAVKTGWNDSPEASAILTLPSGSDGTTVTLFDLEDHNWTYYSGVSSAVDGGNYNTNYVGKLYSPDPRNVKITYKANGGAVSIDESETEFVYYKTIEKINGAYKYTVISNPFSKRPNGKGFGGWKIKEGAQYISGYNDEATLPLDQELTLTGLDANYTPNCTSAEIELEATWVNLNNITYANNNTITYNVSGGNYETNILVLNRNVTGVITTSSPVTIMMVEPDGSADYRNTYSFTGNITPNNAGVTKIEFTKWNSNNTLNCNNHSVTVGRGMTTTSQCANYVVGVTGNTNQYYAATYNSNLNYHLKLESGTFTDVSFISGTEGTDGYVNCNGTSNQIKGTLGNDYDRAKEDNTKLNIIDELFLGYRPTYADGNQNNANFTCWVKSGNLGSGINITNTTFNYQGNPNGGYYGDASQVFYVSIGGNQRYIGKRKLYVEGGILPGIAGGIDQYNPANEESFYLRMTGGTVRGVVYGSGAFAASSGIRRFIITGGTINGWVAAGCNGTDPTQSGGTLPSDTYIYIGGTTHVGNTTDLNLNTSSDGNVFGAGSGNAAQATTGQVNNSNVVIADNSYVKNNVFGGGNYGYSNATATVYVTGGEVNGSIFGGSNQKQGVNAVVNMTGGQVNTGIYGGSNVTGTLSGNVTININGGQVGTESQTANVHGGGLGEPTRVNGDVTLNIGNCNNGTATIYGDVYGGSAMGTVNDQGTDKTTVSLYNGTIYGGLYGGGYGPGGEAADVEGAVQVNVFGGSVLCSASDPDGEAGTGSVFGCNNVSGSPRGSVKVDIYKTADAPGEGRYALHAVYGGGNRAPYEGTPVVTIHGCNSSIEYVYGGGNATDVDGTDVTIWGGTIGNAFGGGNGYSVTKNRNNPSAPHYNPGADILIYGTHLNIYGGTVLAAFGGSNQYGTITGGVEVNVDPRQETAEPPACVAAYTKCPMDIYELYGGGNEAPLISSRTPAPAYIPQDDVDISIGCESKVRMLFGGAKAADYVGDIVLTVDGGNFDKVFGGNNKGGVITGEVTVNFNGGSAKEVYGGCNESGTITRSITVNIDSTDGRCGEFYVENVYGGGNLAAYTAPTTDGYTGKYPEVNIKQGTVRENVYGGGFGSTAIVTGTPVVTVGVSDAGKTARVWGHVFGGGNAAAITGNTSVNILYNSLVKGHVFGGGNAAAVSTNTFVLVRDKAKVYGNIYGGGNQGEVGGNTKVVVNGD